MYKILYLTYHPEIGGGETILLSLLSKLNKKLFEPIVVVTKRGQLSKKLEGLKIKTYVLPLPGYFIRSLFIPGISPIGIYNFYKLCKKIKPDLVHINHLNLAIYAGISAKILKIPTIATAHGSWDSIYFYQDLITQIFADKILAITPEINSGLTKRNIIKHNKIKTIIPGVDVNRFKPSNKNTARKELNLPQKDFIFTIVGRLDPTKDHLTFLKAAQIFLSQNHNKNTRFLIVGSKLGNFTNQKNMYLNKIHQYLEMNPTLKDKVIFFGFCDKMQVVYQATDILICSSTAESFGMALAEAGACEIPIISTNGPGQSQVIKNGKTGLLVPIKNPKILAYKMLSLSKNQQTRNRLGENARKQIAGHFQLQPYVTKIENVYLSLLHNQLKSKRS